MFAGKKSAQIREILISESAWEEMTCLFAPSLSTDASMRIINDKYIARIDDAEVQNSVRKTFRINGLTSRQLSWWTFIIVAIMAIINIIFLCFKYF
ncbi:hypothetical protein EJB31_04295 [Klebsiella pneumoniae]|nr:hypothetical protein [Klebsiella pneumoniae]